MQGVPIGDDDHLDIGIVLDRQQAVVQVVHEFIAQDVVFLGAVEGHDRVAVVGSFEQGKGHVVPPVAVPRAEV